VTAAERASEGQKKPVEGRFKGIPVAYASEIDGSAMWAPCEQHNLRTSIRSELASSSNPSSKPIAIERWNQILHTPAALTRPRGYAPPQFSRRGVPASNSSRAWLLSAPCHCVNDSLTRRKTETRFCRITFTQPHTPFGGK